MGIVEVLSPRYIDDREEFKEAMDFKRSIAPLEETDYGWTYDYARDLYERYARVYKDLDDKANEIIKYLGGGAGLFTLAVIANVRPETVGIVGWSIPSFIVALTAVALASMARQPLLTCLPPPAKRAYDYAESYGKTEAAKGAFVGEWGLACVGMDLAIDIKARRVLWATWAYFGAICLLGLPLLKAIKMI